MSESDLQGMGYGLGRSSLSLLGPVSPQATGLGSRGLLVLLRVPVSGVCLIIVHSHLGLRSALRYLA